MLTLYEYQRNQDIIESGTHSSTPANSGPAATQHSRNDDEYLAYTVTTSKKRRGRRRLGTSNSSASTNTLTPEPLERCLTCCSTGVVYRFVDDEPQTPEEPFFRLNLRHRNQRGVLCLLVFAFVLPLYASIRCLIDGLSDNGDPSQIGWSLFFFGIPTATILCYVLATNARTARRVTLFLRIFGVLTTPLLIVLGFNLLLVVLIETIIEGIQTHDPHWTSLVVLVLASLFLFKLSYMRSAWRSSVRMYREAENELSAVKKIRAKIYVYSTSTLNIRTSDVLVARDGGEETLEAERSLENCVNRTVCTGHAKDEHMDVNSQSDDIHVGIHVSDVSLHDISTTGASREVCVGGEDHLECMERGVVEGTDVDVNAANDVNACIICLETYKDTDQVMELPCSHVFHPLCLVKWIDRKTQCPLCKGHCTRER